MKQLQELKQSVPEKTYFESVKSLVLVHLAPGASNTISGELLDLWNNIAIKAHIHASMVLIDIVLELLIAHFVARFKFPVVFRFLLNGVVCQMHHAV